MPEEPSHNSTTPLDGPTGNAGFSLGLPFKIGALVILLFFGFFLGWALFAPLESAAIAPGEVSVDTKRKSIQHLEGGIVG